MKRSIFLEASKGAGDGGSGGAGSGGVLGGSSQQSSGQQSSQQQGSIAQPWTWADEGGKFADGWIDKLPEELRGEASLKVVDSVGNLAKSYVATKKMVGKKLEAPGEGATPEQLAEWRKIVGAPEKPEDYYSGDVKSFRPDNVPETLWSADTEKKFLAEVAHKHHLSPAVVRDILKFQGDMTAAAVGQSQQAIEAQIATEKGKLQKAWGADFESNSALAKRVAQTAGLDPAMINSAALAVAFAKLGKLFSEDKLVKGDNSGISGSIKDRIRDIQDPKSQSVPAREYRGEFGPERQAAIQKQLHELYGAQQ